MTMTSDTDQFRDLLDRWEELHEQGQEPNQEELCRDAPHLTERLREWTRVLTSGDWLNRRADEVADETLGEHGTLTAEEKDRYRTLGEYDLLEELGGGGDGCIAAGRDQLDDDRLGRVCGAALLKGRSHLTVALCCLSICTSMEARAGLP